jgi:hypothetical protein
MIGKATLAGDTKILMVIHNGYDPEEHVVLFADPLKLAPVMDAINRCEHNPWLLRKQLQAREGIESARADAKIMNPLPMASAVLCFGTEIRFDDGITRTTELVYQKAEFVPLQVPRNHSDSLHGMIGIDGMPMRPAASYIARCNLGKVWLSDEAGFDINRHMLSA